MTGRRRSGRAAETAILAAEELVSAQTVDRVVRALLRHVTVAASADGAALVDATGRVSAFHELSSDGAASVASRLSRDGGRAAVAGTGGIVIEPGFLAMRWRDGTVVVPYDDRHIKIGATVQEALRTILRIATLAYDRAETTERERIDRRLLQEREAQLAEAQRTARLGSYTWNVATSEITWSDEMFAILGFAPGATLDPASAFLERVHPDDRERVRAAWRLAPAGADPLSIEYRVELPDGSVRWILGMTRPVLGDDGSVARVVGTLQDVTDLRAAEERFRALLEAAPDPMVIVGDDGLILLVNAQTERMFGYTSDELVGQPVERLIPPRFRAGHPERRQSYLQDGRPRFMGDGQELVAQRKDGSELLVEIALGPIETPTGRLVSAAIRDITERKAAEEAIAFHATHDTLTKLPNRVLFLDRLEQELARRPRHGRGVGVLFLDLDHFKWVNDSLGHASGDAALTSVADRLRDAMRPGDTVARFGGDEFVVLCQDVDDLDDLLTVAERLREATSEPMVIGGEETTITVSVGIAFARADAVVTAEGLVRDADTAMYEAKEKGRDRYDVFDTAARLLAVSRQEMSHALRKGIERDELVVVFQPEIDLGTNSVAGVEALARWRHPTRGTLDPGQFIPVAEESGLIVPLGNRILRTACEDVVAWGERTPALGDLTLSVNLSARQLLSPGLPAVVEGALRDSGLTPSRLCLEITESVLLRDAESAARALEQLKEIGVQIGVDDFGTGYSSLTYLKRFPVDVLKIDRSFVTGVGTSSEDRAIVASVIDLAHAFDLTTIAEGVESRYQLEQLRALGCAMAQGYLWSRPVTAGAAEAWIGEWRATTPYSDGTLRPIGDRTVLLVEDDASLRQLLRVVLDEDQDFRVVAEAGDGREAIALARRFHPDIVVLDLAMPGIGGLEAIPLILGVSPRTKVVVLSGLEPGSVADAVRRLGAAAFLRKGNDAYRLPDLLRLSLAS